MDTMVCSYPPTIPTADVTVLSLGPGPVLADTLDTDPESVAFQTLAQSTVGPLVGQSEPWVVPFGIEGDPD